MRLRGPAWLQEIPRPIRSGHRGAAGLVAANTLRSYAEAVRLGCDLVEVDVQPTADGVLVLLHETDITVNGILRPVAALSLAELRRAAPDVPTLAQALALLGDRAVPLLDLKGVGFEAQLGADVQQAGLQRAIVCGQPLSSLLATQRANPAVATSLTLDAHGLEGIDDATVTAIPTDAVTVHYRRLTAAIVGLFHEQGITVIAWTVDDPATMRELVAIGVDGITSNRPDLLVALFPR
ncbi:MAG TPA: glycerophosphodiester phosphodiesterase [Chloroflexota bacterium]